MLVHPKQTSTHLFPNVFCLSEYFLIFPPRDTKDIRVKLYTLPYTHVYICVCVCVCVDICTIDVDIDADIDIKG